MLSQRPEHQHFINLLEKLLQYEPSKRITLSSALRHPFLVQPQQQQLQPVRSRVWRRSSCEMFRWNPVAHLACLPGAWRQNLTARFRSSGGKKRKKKAILSIGSLSDELNCLMIPVGINPPWVCSSGGCNGEKNKCPSKNCGHWRVNYPFKVYQEKKCWKKNLSIFFPLGNISRIQNMFSWHMQTTWYRWLSRGNQTHFYEFQFF